jgi:hypothetical protein
MILGWEGVDWIHLAVVNTVVNGCYLLQLSTSVCCSFIDVSKNRRESKYFEWSSWNIQGLLSLWIDANRISLLHLVLLIYEVDEANWGRSCCVEFRWARYPYRRHCPFGKGTWNPPSCASFVYLHIHITQVVYPGCFIYDILEHLPRPRNWDMAQTESRGSCYNSSWLLVCKAYMKATT